MSVVYNINDIPGLTLIRPKLFKDKRGENFEGFDTKNFSNIIKPDTTLRKAFKHKRFVLDTFSKSSFKSKPHKRQSQIINLVHQRVRAAYKNAKDPKVKARLKKAFDYAKKKKEASKKKTQRMRKND